MPIPLAQSRSRPATPFTHEAFLSVLQRLNISSRVVCDPKLVSQFNCVSDNSILNSEENCFVQLSPPEIAILPVVFAGQLQGESSSS